MGGDPQRAQTSEVIQKRAACTGRTQSPNRSIRMKEIKAYIHDYRIADVIRALKESGQCECGRRLPQPHRHPAAKPAESIGRQGATLFGRTGRGGHQRIQIGVDLRRPSGGHYRARRPHRPNRSGMDLRQRSSRRLRLQGSHDIHWPIYFNQDRNYPGVLNSHSEVPRDTYSLLKQGAHVAPTARRD